ncbi:MAG: replication factor C large subunit [Methanoregula sp.]|jgi:replication factor C large subunit|uniref:replication factor C large subunit n=1 Tax=Methanoregula sp. TaxID=2052170 RepID=UPI0025F660A8|nr:replication factor C large subunit [Methanoregula sp.]MCK9631236.1 replication factor C large subunit [Methanoregula sp.]
MDWAEKYRPAHLADIVGNTTAVRQIAEWARNWTNKSRPLMIYGKPGIGKTSAAYALANDMNWEVIELNASDQRTAGVIERIAGAGSVTASLTGATRKLVVLDEADNLQGNADRGGAKAIIECIRHAQQPMVLIANDLYGLSPEIRARCDPVQFKAVPARSIAPRLKYLCAAEKISCSDAAIHAIADSAEGDIRSAVNMLYASAIGRDNLDDVHVHTSQKDERVSIFSLISALFGRTGDEELMRLSYDVNDTPETIEQWVEGSVHLIEDPAAMGRAYRHLSRADEYLGYTYRRQYHTLWRYATAVMLLGVADAAGGKGIHTRIMPPERWQKMSTAKKQKSIRLATLNKVSAMMHMPQNTLRENYLGTISLLVEQDPTGYARELSFDADQLNFFLNDRARSTEIIKALMKEEKEREKETVQRKKVKKEPKKEKPRVEPAPVISLAETPPEPRPPKEEPIAPKDEPETKKVPAKTQSTLFDGF